MTLCDKYQNLVLTHLSPGGGGGGGGGVDEGSGQKFRHDVAPPDSCAYFKE